MDTAGVLTLGASLVCAGFAGMKVGVWGYACGAERLARYRAAHQGKLPSFDDIADLLRATAIAAMTRIPRLDAALAAMRSARRKRELRQSLPQAIRLLCISLDSGGSLQQALEYAAKNSTGVASKELRRAVWDIRAGKSFDEAMEGLRARTQGNEFSCLVVAMEIQHRCGGTLGQILASVSQMLQQSADLEEELVTKTTQAQLSARVVALMPVVVLVLLSLVSPGYLGQFFESVFGIALLVMAALLEIAGVVLVRRSMAVDVGAGG